MVLYFVDNYIRSGGQLPKKMIEDNIRVDYNKLRMTEIKGMEMVVCEELN